MLQTYSYGVLRAVALAVVIVSMMTATPGDAGTSSVFGRLHEALCNASRWKRLPLFLLCHLER